MRCVRTGVTDYGPGWKVSLVRCFSDPCPPLPPRLRRFLLFWLRTRLIGAVSSVCVTRKRVSAYVVSGVFVTVVASELAVCCVFGPVVVSSAPPWRSGLVAASVSPDVGGPRAAGVGR